MKIRNLFASVAVAAALAVSASPAKAVLISGWDFSAYAPGLLTTDNASPNTALGSQYSTPSISPTNPLGLGDQANPFGTMYINGQNGSTEIIPTFDGTEIVRPLEESLGSNLDAPDSGDFDDFNLQGYGQLNMNPIKMGVFAPAQVVFSATTGTLPLGSFFEASVLTFAGQIFPGGTGGSIGIEVSTDGNNYSPVTSVNLTALDQKYTVQLPPGQTNQLFVRFNFGETANINNIHTFDNVAISGMVTVIPEPGTLLLLVSGITGLAVTGRRRA